MFKSKRALMFLALALVVAMTVMTPLAIARDTGGSNGGNKPGSSDNSKGNKNDSHKNKNDNRGYNVGHPDKNEHDAQREGPSRKDKSGTTDLVNAGNKLKQATLFWKAAFWFNTVGEQRFGVHYDFPVGEWDLKLDEARAQYDIASNPATSPAAALAAARLCSKLSEALKNEIESTIHAGGRSVGEYNTKSHLRVLVFGSDSYVLTATSQWLTNYDIQNEIALDKTLKSYNLCNYDVIVFDPEYSVYGKTAGTGTDIFGPGTEGRYGGLSPEDSAYLQGYLSSGKAGLVYMEPVYMAGYMPSSYCEFGQIPFLKVAVDWWSSAWSVNPVDANVVLPDNPIAYGLPPEFTVSTSGQWNSIDVMADPLITNKNVVCTAEGFEIIGFNYGQGKVSLTGMDNWGAADDTNIGKIIRNSVLWANPY